MERRRGTRRSLGLAVAALFVAWVAPAVGAGQGRRAERGAGRSPTAACRRGCARTCAGGRQVRAAGAARQRHGGRRPDQAVPQRRGHRPRPRDRARARSSRSTRAAPAVSSTSAARSTSSTWPAATSAACRRWPRVARASSIRRCGPGATRSAASRSRGASAPGATSACTPASAGRNRLGSRRPGSTDVDANVVAYAGGTSGNRVQHYEIRVHRLRGRTDCLIAKSTERLSAPRNDNTVSSPVLSGGLRLLEPQRQPRHLAGAHHARADPGARLQARPGRARDGRPPAGELRLGGRRREGLLLELRRACSRPTCRPSPPPRPGSGSARSRARTGAISARVQSPWVWRRRAATSSWW